MTRLHRPSTQRMVGFIAALILSTLVLFGCTSTAAPSAGSDASDSAESGASDSANPKSAEVKEGVEAPDFEFALVDGSTAKLSDYRGKVVVLNFWATWCGYCVREMPDLNDIAQNYDDVQVLAINRGDTPADAKEGIEEYGYDFVWGLDEDRAIEALYPASGIPYTVVIDKDGVVSSIFAGSAPDMYPYFEEAVTKAGAGA
ncbi:TlpA family protein disulfide reductase [Raoultibacter phocaeensis]|uniref:TlpA family protein disulfide reductase n=1 Tax=Raoultibacter phocaeensis TaxID=2479841 RepID=UPI00111A5BAE|nr:TlpA disulfide reductase family protein [Raoultibacter phocaeensis]